MKTRLLLFTTLILGMSVSVFAQSFSYQSSSLPELSRSSMDIADYDGDGDLDLVVGGMLDSFGAATYLFENQEGTFVETDVELPAISDGVVLFADVDMDGDMDLFLSGNGNTEPFTALYMNEGGSFTSADISVTPMGGNTDAAFGDYDKDGDLDLLVSGNDETFLYNYDEGEFTSVAHPFVNLNYATTKWVDYDNDGDLDLALAGELGAVPATRIYTNVDGEFEESGIVLQDVMSGDMAWGDYDNDGDKDLAIVGFDEYLTGKTMVYRNDGDGAFKNLSVNILGVSKSTADWGDMDNDGDLDLLVSGSCDDCGVLMTSIFENDNGSFSDIFPGFQNTERGDARFADYDNDGDVDVLVFGQNLGGDYLSLVYQNDARDNSYHANEAPAKPANLSVDNLGNEVVLSWSAASDDFTPQNSLTYNVRVGTTPGGDEIINCMSGGDGALLLPGMGNANQSLSLQLTHLPVGTYYWSVQTIDHQYHASEFTDEQSFSITATGIDHPENEMAVYPVPFTNSLTVKAPGADFKQAVLMDLTGKTILQKEIKGSQATFNTAALTQGIYILQMQSEKEMISRKIVK